MKNTLKLAAFFAALILFCTNDGFGQESSTADTIMINFGNESKIIIYVNDQNDLDALANYDINSMLRDLNMEIEETEGDINYLKIEDQTGERYLKDTTVILESNQKSAKNEEWFSATDSTKNEEKGIHKSLVIEAPGFKTKDRTKSKHSFNIELGLNNYFENGNLGAANSEAYEVKPFGSWYIGLTSKRKSKVAGSFYLEWGGGISWYNFKMENPDIQIIKGEDGILFQEVPTEINGIKSKLTASFVNFSLIPLLDFSQGRRKEALNFHEGPIKITKYNRQGLRVGFGPYIGYRLGSHSKFKFEENNDVEKDKDRGSFYLNNLRYGLRLQLGYKGLDLFANYDLNPLFKENHGPELNAFSFGIIL
jgi:hypothetical protein